MKKMLLIGVFSISLLAPGLFAAGDAKLSGEVTKTLTGKTTSLVQDIRELAIPVLVLTAVYTIAIKPISVVAYKKVGNVLSKSNNYNSWIARPFQLISSLWNLLIPHDLSQFATRTYVDSKLRAYTPNLSHYVTQADLEQNTRGGADALGRFANEKLGPLVKRVETLEQVHNVEQLKQSVTHIASKLESLEQQIDQLTQYDDDSQEDAYPDSPNALGNNLLK